MKQHLNKIKDGVGFTVMIGHGNISTQQYAAPATLPSRATFLSVEPGIRLVPETMAHPIPPVSPWHAIRQHCLVWEAGVARFHKVR